MIDARTIDPPFDVGGFSIGVLTQKNIGNVVHHCRKMVQSSILKICYILGSNVICMCIYIYICVCTVYSTYYYCYYYYGYIHIYIYTPYVILWYITYMI